VLLRLLRNFCKSNYKEDNKLKQPVCSKNSPKLTCQLLHVLILALVKVAKDAFRQFDCQVCYLISFSMSSTVVSPSELKSLEDCLCNANGNTPLHTRFRALFTLKALKTEDAVKIISTGAVPLLSLYFIFLR
jgi:hypothetical protein